MVLILLLTSCSLSFLTVAVCAANPLNPLAQLGLGQFGPSFNSALSQLNSNEVYNLLSGCFPFYPNHAAHLMGRAGQATGQPGSASSPSAAIASLASNPALALAQYQQLQQPPQQTHPQ